MEEKIFVENRQGLKLATVIHRPKGNGQFPVIVLLHGFTGYKDEGHIAALAQELAQNGFVTIRFDASGFGESEGTIESDYRLSNFYGDTEVIFEYAKSLDYVDPDRLGIWGNSLGGTLAIIFAASHSWLKAVCTVSTPTMFARKDNFKRRTKTWKETGYYKKVSSRYGKLKIPYDFVIDSQKWNVLEHVEQVHQPSLYIVGTADENVYPANTKEIFALANEPKKLIEIENMDHFYKKIPGFITTVNLRVINFYKENL